MTSLMLKLATLGPVLLGLGCATTDSTRTTPMRLEDVSLESAWAMSDLRLLTNDFIRRCVERPTWATKFAAAERRKPVLWIGMAVTDKEDIPANAVTAAIAQSFGTRDDVFMVEALEEADFAVRSTLDCIRTESLERHVEVHLGYFVVVDLVRGEVVCFGHGTNPSLFGGCS